MKLPFAIAVACVLAACAGTSNVPSEDESFNRLAAQTELEIRQAEKAGFLWRDTEPLLADARKAKKEGRDDEAMKLVRRALRQAQLAQQQARDNANAGPSYPTNP